MQRFLVVDPIALVAEDLAGCIREVLPAADVEIALTLPAALELAGAGPQPIAFVPARMLDAAPAGRLVAATRGIVATGGAHPAGGVNLDVPFSCESVRTVLQRIGGLQGPPHRDRPVSPGA